jgi:hypothetical protein
MSKVVFKNFYLVNKLQTGLVMKAGYISLKVGGFAKVLESDLEHPDIMDSVNKGWVEVHSEVPDAADLPKPIVPIIETEGYKGLTAEELLKSTDTPAESTASSVALGQSGVEKTGEAAASTAIGKSAEETNTGKRGRKAADKTEATE